MLDNFIERWHNVEKLMVERFGKKPNMEAMLFLIGLNEIGKLKKKYTKEQKQDLMHVAMCTLLAQSGYYAPDGLDADGWPHFKVLQPVPPMNGLLEQEFFIKEHIIAYFESEEDIEGITE